MDHANNELGETTSVVVANVTGVYIKLETHIIRSFLVAVNILNTGLLTGYSTM